MKLVKAMATVAGLTAISRIAGFVRDIITAAFMGAGPVADAFFVALKLPNLFRRITAEGAFSVSFVPLYSRTVQQEGQEEAARFASGAFSVMLAALSVFTLLAMCAMPWVIYVIAPGFTDDATRYDLAVTLSRITFPYLLLMSLTALLGGVLNSMDRFAPFAMAPLIFNLSLIAMLLVSGLFETPGHAMAWGVVVSGVLQFVWLLSMSRRLGVRIRLVRPRLDPKIRQVFRLMGPGLIGAGAMQINLFADMIIASMLPSGSISYLYYADRLNQMPLGIVGIAVGTALLPMLSRAIAAGQEAEGRNLFNRGLEICFLFGLPAAVALLVAAPEIIGVLFERGQFGAHDTRMTAYVLMGYAIGMPAYICVKVFSTAYWARQDTMTPVKVAIVSALFNVAACLCLIWFIGVAGIAVATGLAGWLQFVLLRRKLAGMEAARTDARFRRSLPRIIGAAAAMGAVIWLIGFALAPAFEGVYGGHGKLFALAALVGGGAAVYGAGITLTGVFTWRDLKHYFRRDKIKKQD